MGMTTGSRLALGIAACLIGIQDVNPADKATIRACTQLFTGKTSYGPGPGATAQPACLWKTRTLHVRFIGGDARVKSRIRRIAAEWTRYTGITLIFDDAPKAQIVISFAPTGSWSYVGQCQDDRTTAPATMNYGWLEPDTEEAEYRRVVLHEFGHALGMVHEHQNPAGNIHWDEEAVYDHYWRTQGWDRSKTHLYVIQKYSSSETNFTAYDSTSIMQYPIPRELTTDHVEVGWNRELSPVDKKFMRDQYHAGAK